jgi:hypothetical protein
MYPDPDSDPDAYPDLSIFIIDLQDANKKQITLLFTLLYYPDPGGPKTGGSGESGFRFGSATLLGTGTLEAENT